MISWAVLAALWISAILAQRPLPRTLGRWVLPLAIVLLATWALRAVIVTIRRGPPRRRLFLALIAVALVVRLVGVDYEVEERAYQDEGTYYHHATKINEGEVLRFSFVYPHVLYYLNAFTLWNVSLYPGVWEGFCQRIFQTSEAIAQSWLALRILAALISVLAAAAVYRVGQRFAGPLAGALGAAFLIFSPLYNDGAHLIISDVPSASLAAVSWMFAAGLLLREGRRDYLLAGIFAGLAAATKYPAGVVAVAIVAAWIRGRLRDRRFNWDLVLSGAVSLGTFLAVMPTFFLYPRLAIYGDRGMLFGFRQYSEGGWIGVMPKNIPAYYGAELATSFGIPALLLGLAGLALCLLSRGSTAQLTNGAKLTNGASPGNVTETSKGLASRAQLLWLLIFPLVYLGLIASMNMVVRRNLYPALPPLAVLLGIGLAGGIRRLEVPRATWRKVLATGLVLIALAPPVSATLLQSVSLTRPSTREAAAAWIQQHLPPGAAIIKESYTPRLSLGRYALWQQRFAGRLSLEQIRDPSQDFLLLARPAYGRFLQDEALREDHHVEISQRYREMLDTFEQIAEFAPSATRRGPWLELYRISNLPTPPLPGHTFAATEAFVPDGAMRPKDSRVVEFRAPGHWVSFKGRFAPDRYRLQPQGTFASPPRLRVLDLDNRVLAEDLADPFEVPIATEEKILIYVFAEPGDQLRGLAVKPVLEVSGDGKPKARPIGG